MKKVLLLVIALLFFSCYEEVYKFDIKNNAEFSVYYYEATPNSQTFMYPDTTLVERKYIGEVKPFKTNHIGGFVRTETLIKELPKDTLSIYFFHSDTIKKYSWENIRNNYRILKRYDLSIQDIQLLDYEIPYPPSQQMKKMRMYPPYNE